MVATEAPASLHATAPKKQRPAPGYSGMLPIRPDMLSFVRWRENLAPDQPIQLPGHGAIANYLSDLIDFGKSLYFPNANRIAPENPLLTARLKFHAAPGLLDETFFEYADLVAYYFNEYLYKHWLDSQATFIGSAMFYAPRLDAKDVLSDYMRQTGVDEFREQDADIKAYYRLRLSRHQVTPKRKSGG